MIVIGLNIKAEGEDEEADGKTRLKRMEGAFKEVEESLLEEVENMEERVCSASLQVKVC